MSCLQVLGVIAVSLLLIAGCADGPDYADGTWRFIGDSSDEHGWTPVLLAETSDGDIARARYDFLSSEGVYLSQDFETLRIRSHAENIDLEQALLLLTETFEEQPEAEVEVDGPPWLLEPYHSLTEAFRQAATGEQEPGDITVVDVPLPDDGVEPSLASDYLSF